MESDRKFTITKSLEFIKKTYDDRVSDISIMNSDIVSSLKCQYTQELIKYPVRGINCDHFACFDLNN